MAKFAVEIIVDTDPDGVNDKRALFDSNTLMMVLPYLARWLNPRRKPDQSNGNGNGDGHGPTDDIGGPPPSGEARVYGAGSKAAEVLRDIERSTARTVQRETQENG